MTQDADVPEHELFESNRKHLTALAYRMTGSLAEAEDIVQEAYLRWKRSGADTVRHPRAFLSKTVTRLCLDFLKSARKRRESYVGPWLPEPLVGSVAAPDSDAGELARDVSTALMLALERLTPLERAVFLLREVFDVDYQDVAGTVGRSEDACRQLVSRAKKNIAAARPRYQPSRDECERVVEAFGAAVITGDLTQLEATLADDAILYADGGGRVRSALRPIHGANRIARFFIGVTKKSPFSSDMQVLPRLVNGSPGFVIVDAGEVVQTMAFEVTEGRVRTIYAVRNPDKLARLSVLS
ncbi:MAG: sigma-70 family RNA polymerase sigma factor [Myxococcota bacterium]